MKEHNYKTSLRKWKMKPQECPGTYMFDGFFVITCEVLKQLQFEERIKIMLDIHNYIQKYGSADYLFVFEHKDQKIFVIDNLNIEMKKDQTELFNRENNYFTIMFAHEY